MIESKIESMGKRPKLKSPILISGLPGLGLVGKLAVDHMIKQVKAKPFARIYSPHFPPQVNILQGGTIEVPHDTFYFVRGNSKSGNDLIILAGDYQATTAFGHYEIAGDVLDFVKKMGVKQVYTLGGYGVGFLSKNPKVFAAVTDEKLKKKVSSAGATFDRVGGIVGAAGLLIGLGKLKKMQGVCLMGETHGQIIDARAAKSVLEVLSRLIGFKIDVKELEKRATEIEKEINKQQKQVESPELKEDFNPQYIR